MKKLSWEEYVEKFDSWAESTQCSYVSRLESFGSHEEVAEIALCLNEAASSKLINMAIDAGIRFDEEDIFLTEFAENPETWQRMKDTADNSELYSRRRQERKDEFWSDTAAFMFLQTMRDDRSGKK